MWLLTRWLASGKQEAQSAGGDLPKKALRNEVRMGSGLVVCQYLKVTRLLKVIGLPRYSNFYLPGEAFRAQTLLPSSSSILTATLHAMLTICCTTPSKRPIALSCCTYSTILTCLVNPTHQYFVFYLSTELKFNSPHLDSGSGAI
jgi:hypothetical protein